MKAARMSEDEYKRAQERISHKLSARADNAKVASSYAEVVSSLPGFVDPRGITRRWADILPWPPSDNRSHVPGDNNHRRYRSQAYRAYRREVARQVKNLGLDWRMTGRLLVRVYATEPQVKRRRDITNLWKTLLDTLQHAGVYVNDSQIDDARITRVTYGKPGTVAIYIEEITDAATTGMGSPRATGSARRMAGYQCADP